MNSGALNWHPRATARPTKPPPAPSSTLVWSADFLRDFVDLVESETKITRRNRHIQRKALTSSPLSDLPYALSTYTYSKPYRLAIIDHRILQPDPHEAKVVSLPGVHQNLSTVYQPPCTLAAPPGRRPTIMDQNPVMGGGVDGQISTLRMVRTAGRFWRSLYGWIAMRSEI